MFLEALRDYIKPDSVCIHLCLLFWSPLSAVVRLVGPSPGESPCLALSLARCGLEKPQKKACPPAHAPRSVRGLVDQPLLSLSPYSSETSNSLRPLLPARWWPFWKPFACEQKRATLMSPIKNVSNMCFTDTRTTLTKLLVFLSCVYTPGSLLSVYLSAIGFIKKNFIFIIIGTGAMWIASMLPPHLHLVGSSWEVEQTHSSSMEFLSVCLEKQGGWNVFF